MSATIFCTFEQQDLADLAVGKLRASTAGIKSIHYIADYNRHHDTLHPQEGTNSFTNFFTASTWNTAPMPSRPVTVKIVCTDSACNTVVARLINLHGYQIITTKK